MVKKDEHNPYPYPLEALRDAENDYCIQVGYDLYMVEGVVVFPPEVVEKIYDTVIYELREMLKKGTEQEKNDARFFISKVHIHPIRIH